MPSAATPFDSKTGAASANRFARTWCTAMLAAFTLSACMVSEVDPKPQVDYDPGTDFSRYSTFAWKLPDPIVVATDRPVAEETRRELLKETARQLETKGLRQLAAADADSDLVVSIAIGSRSGVKLNNYPGRWGGSYIDLREITTAGIGVDLTERGSGQLLWSGWATTPLTEEVYADRNAVVRKVVDTVLGQFPPGP